MTRNPLKEKDWSKITLIGILFLLVLIIINTVTIALMLNYFNTHFPNTRTQLGIKQAAAQDLVEYNRRLAAELEVMERPPVRDALAGFNYDIETAANSDELTKVILNHARSVQETIIREWEKLLQDRIIILLNQDNNVRTIEDTINITLEITEDQVDIKPFNILNDETTSQIIDVYAHNNIGRKLSLEIEIKGGEAALSTTYNPVDYINTLLDEINSLRTNIRELREVAGFAEMSGAGIVIKLYDEPGAVHSHGIIHDTDIRDIVNELFASGAQGVSVGGQRLTASWSIRCSGPVIKVNDKTISVKPVEIVAVGNPDILSGGLEIIRNTMELIRGMKFEIEEKDMVILPAFTRN